MAGKSKASAKPRRPNIVIFMMDTQGARNMSCYGYRLKTSPNIDRIAAEGALYLNHFVTSPWTLPAHASLFTGRYESGHGAGAQHEGLEPGLPQMGEVFTETAIEPSPSAIIHGPMTALTNTPRERGSKSMSAMARPMLSRLRLTFRQPIRIFRTKVR